MEKSALANWCQDCKAKRERPDNYCFCVEKISFGRLVSGEKECLFIRTQTHNLQIFGVIPFVKLQNNTLNNS